MRLHTFGGLWLAQDDGAPAAGLSQPRRLTLLAIVASGDTTWRFGYLALGDHAEALRLLNRGVSERDPAMLYLQVEPELDGLRGDPRFEAIAARAHLP